MSIWKESPIFPEHYMVSDKGEVLSIRTNKILAPATDKYGYHYYVLCVAGDRRTIKAHRLVAKAFIPNPQEKPTVNHKNGIRTDNQVNNLEWATNKEQTNDPLTYQHLIATMKQRDFKAMGAIRNYGRISVVVMKNGVLIGTFPSLKMAAEHTKVSQGKVSQCVSGQVPSCKGYTFKSAT